VKKVFICKINVVLLVDQLHFVDMACQLSGVVTGDQDFIDESGFELNLKFLSLLRTSAYNYN